MLTELEFKKDFSRAAEQWDKFWKRKNTRPSIAAVLPKPGVTPVPAPSTFAVGEHGDFKPAIDQLLAWAETHDFLADAIPYFYLEFAADSFASLLGAELRFTAANEGGWAVPCITDLDHADIRFQREGRWWQRTVEFAQALRARCDGKLMIAGPSLVANLDALAALYGSENLLVAMVDSPDSVHRALRQVDKAHQEVLEALEQLLGYAEFGSITRHSMYNRGRCGVIQCDFSCMISPDMFREFALPYMAKEISRLDAADYHLDGPGAAKHLEAVCGLAGLRVIQWQRGAGLAEQQDWTGLYDRIDACGKGMLRGWHYDAVNPETAKALWRKYRDPGLFVVELQAGSKAEVEDCLADLEKISPLKLR